MRTIQSCNRNIWNKLCIFYRVELNGLDKSRHPLTIHQIIFSSFLLKVVHEYGNNNLGSIMFLSFAPNLGINPTISIYIFGDI